MKLQKGTDKIRSIVSEVPYLCYLLSKIVEMYLILGEDSFQISYFLI